MNVHIDTSQCDTEKTRGECVTTHTLMNGSDEVNQSHESSLISHCFVDCFLSLSQLDASCHVICIQSGQMYGLAIGAALVVAGHMVMKKQGD